MLFFALMRLGAIPVLTLPAHRITEIGHLARLSEAVAYVIADEHGGFDYRELPPRLRARRRALRHVLVAGDPGPFTALAARRRRAARRAARARPGRRRAAAASPAARRLPKLIPRTHDDYAYNARASAEVCGARPPTRVYLAALPVAHNFPLACPGRARHARRRRHASCSRRRPRPDDCVRAHRARAGHGDRARAAAGRRCGSTPPSGTPPTCRACALLQVGGAKLSAELAREIAPALGARAAAGLRDGRGPAQLHAPRRRPPSSWRTTQGRPLCAARRAARRRRATAPRSRPARSASCSTRGPYTLRGYYRAPEHNARRLHARRLLPHGRPRPRAARPATWSSRAGSRTRSTAAARTSRPTRSSTRRRPSRASARAAVDRPARRRRRRAACARSSSRGPEPPALRELRAFLIAARRRGVQAARPHRARRRAAAARRRQGRQALARRARDAHAAAD